MGEGVKTRKGEMMTTEPKTEPKTGELPPVEPQIGEWRVTRTGEGYAWHRWFGDLSAAYEYADSLKNLGYTVEVARENPRRWAHEFRHPHFGWLCWEPGDKTYVTQHAAGVAAADCGRVSRYKTRLVRIVGDQRERVGQ